MIRITAAAACASLACAGAGLPDRSGGRAPHDAYEAQLRGLDAQHTALGREWLAAAQRALDAPVVVELPYREARYLDPAGATAVAFRITLNRGQRLVARITVPGATHADLRLFLDLYFVSDSGATPEPIASAGADAWELDAVAPHDGVYLLRVQPELLRGGRATITLSAHASLGFPVAGRGMGQLKSRFGASRDAGARDHEGVDIFAPRGTPVIAAAAGRVSRVGTDRQGGKVVWMEETSHRRRLYYAHLDSQSVRPGRMVKRGDTLGFVGNTGNAHTSPPHLHFAVYWQGSRAVDPYFHLHDPAGRPATFSGDVRLVGSWARTTAPTRIRAEPGDSAGAVSRVEALTPVQVLSGTGRWYLVRLPDGRRGYLGAASAGPLEPITMAAVATPSMLRTFPASFGFELDSIGRGQVVPVLGRYSTHTLVRHPNGLTAWIASGALAAGRTEVGGSNH